MEQDDRRVEDQELSAPAQREYVVRFASMATARTGELLSLAERIAEALPPVVEEVVMTGSVSRGVADDVSDIEMLVVTASRSSSTSASSMRARPGSRGSTRGGRRERRRSASSATARACRSSSSGGRATSPRRPSPGSSPVSPGVGGRARARRRDPLGRAAAGWQERLREYPEELAAERIEDAALTWGGYAPAGWLTLAAARREARARRADVRRRSPRPQDRLCLNRVWPPTTKRLGARLDELPVKPERVAERIEEAFTEPDPARAALA